MRLVNEDNARGLFSFHPGIVQLTLGDGAVKSLDEDVEPRVLLGMATREGGEAAAREISGALAAHGLEVEQARPILPSLEDVFIRRMRSAGGAPDAGATEARA